MTDSGSRKISRLSELPQEIPPPRDGWPALEARLREHSVPEPDHTLARHGSDSRRPHRRVQMRRVGGLAAVVGAIVVGVFLDRWVISPSRPSARASAGPDIHAPGGELTVGYLKDSRYLRARAALRRSLDAQLAALQPSTRRRVLASLATLRQSLREIQHALGREPGNALLQELLIDTAQEQMQMLSATQALSGDGGETRS